MFAVNKEEFLANEKASKDTIDVKRIYIDMAGDLVGGVLLSQIVFWHLPSDKGGSKLRVFHKGEYWIARGRDDYWEDCRITSKQFDRAIKELEALNLVITDIIKFNGSPMKHVRIDWDVFLASYENLLKSYGENGYSPKGKIEIPEKGKTLTESTAETTTKIEEQGADAPTPTAAEQFAAMHSESETPAPVMSEAAREFFRQFTRRRWKTNAEKELFEATEADVGPARMMDAVRWGAQNGIAKVPSICTAAKNGKQDRKNGGGAARGKPSIVDAINEGFALYDEVVHGKRSDHQGNSYQDVIDVSPVT